MVPSFDLFRLDSDMPVWLESVADLETAKERLRTIGLLIPGKFIVFSKETEDRSCWTVDKLGTLSSTV